MASIRDLEKDLWGFVYIATNESFMPNRIKIGSTNEPDPMTRINGLDNTSIPTPFTLYAVLKVPNYQETEVNIQDYFGKHRVRSNREFFDKDPEKVVDYMVSLAKLIPGAEVIKYSKKGKKSQIYPASTGKKSTKKSGKKGCNFTFSRLNIPIGSKLKFIPNPNNIEVTVKTEKTIEYDGKEYTLSGFTKEYIEDSQRTSSETYSGTRYFTYNGKKLSKMK